MIRAHTSYIVCATPRSGSSLLCEALRNTFLAGRAEEYFNPKSEAIWRARWGISSSVDYFRWLTERGTSPNGVFGAKIMWEQMAYCVQLLRQLPQYRHFNYSKSVPELISAVFPNVSYIWIIRRDKVRQAVSDELAIQTGNYAWIGDQKPTSEREPIFNFTRLDFQVNRIIAADNAWEQYFIEARVTPFKVVYEQFVEECERTLRAFLEHLCVHIPPNHSFDRPKLKKMADALNDEWTQRYNQMKTQQPEKDARIRLRLAQWYSSKPEGF